MNRFAHLIGATAVIGLLAAAALAEEEAAPTHQYVGVNGCRMCHKSTKVGEQLRIWQESKHSHAYEVLASPKAREIATAKGIEDPQKAPECLGCHVAGYPLSMANIDPSRKEKADTPEEQAALVAARMAEGVTCEACHGPGSEYKSRKVMKVRENAIAAGLVIPDETVCLACHNDKSPTHDPAKPFNFKEYAAKIAHPIPERD